LPQEFDVVSETSSEAGRARVLAASRVEWTVNFPKVSTRALWMARNLDVSRPAGRDGGMQSAARS
jgi:hypothetical protein